jgi:DNA-directed RNA polymerase subunit omega
LTIAAADLREGLIHSIQKHVEVDEPEEAAVPTRMPSNVTALERDSRSADTIVDTMTEEQLLIGLRELIPEQPQVKGS